MKLYLPPPPQTTGDNSNDVTQLYDWCLTLYTKLRRTLEQINVEGDDSI